MLKITNLSLFTVLLILTLEARAMNLQEYLNIVEENNGAVIAAKKNTEAKLQRQDEHTSSFVPNVFLNGIYSNDQRPNTSPAVLGTKTDRTYYQGGVTQAFRTGTNATLSYNILKTDMTGATAVSEPLFYDVYPQLELSQSLWRNFNGNEIRAQETQQKSQARIEYLSESLKYKQLLMKAELAYWKYYFSQKNLAVQTENLERAKKLRDWNQRRFTEHLVDEADALQTDANYLARELEFQAATEDLAQAERDFLSTIEKESADKSLLNFSEGEKEIKNLNLLKLSVITGEREDVEISHSLLKAAEASASLGLERNKPIWEVYGTYARTGRDAKESKATADAWKNEGPYTTVGTRLIWSLDFAAVSRYKSAYSLEKINTDINHRRKVYEAEKEWKDLNLKYQELQKRLTLVLKIADTQSKKLGSEKKRFSSGRSTTFQVLQFEQDYANAQLSKLKIEEAILALYAQSKLFVGTKYE